MGLYILVGVLSFVTFIIFLVIIANRSIKKDKLKELLEWKKDDELILKNDQGHFSESNKMYKLNGDNLILKLIKWSDKEILIELINGTKKGDQYFIEHNSIKMNKSWSHRQKFVEFDNFEKKVLSSKNEELKEKLDTLIKK